MMNLPSRTIDFYPHKDERHDAHVKAYQLTRAKAWLKGETTLRLSSHYVLDRAPVLRYDAPATAEELGAIRSYESGLVQTVWNFIAGVEG